MEALREEDAESVDLPLRWRSCAALAGDTHCRVDGGRGECRAISHVRLGMTVLRGKWPPHILGSLVVAVRQARDC